MKFSLINVRSQMGTKIIEGSWVQNHVGTLDSATERAIQTENVNSNKLDIAVVEEIAGVQPGLVHYVERLDTPRREHFPMPDTETDKYPRGRKTTPLLHLKQQ